MASNFIKTTVCGNLGKNAIVKTLPSGHKVAVVSIAVNTGDKTDWMTVQVWGDKRAEGVAPKLLKGSLMQFEGTPKANAWTGEDGKLHTELVLNVNYGNEIAWMSNAKPVVEDTADMNTQEIPF